MDLVLFFVEESRGVRVESLLRGTVHEHGDEEAEESDEGEDESHNLPEGVVLSVSDNLSSLVGGDISAEVPHHEGPEAPGDEVLNGEGPPSDEDVVPPLVLLNGVLVVTLSDLKGKIVGSVEEDLLAPSLARPSSGSHDERDNPGNDHDDPEDEDTPSLEAPFNSSSVFTLHDEDGNGSHDEGHEPVDGSDNHGRCFTFVREDVSGLEEPGSSDTLSNTKDEHEVHGDVTISDIEEGESPRGAEEERSAPSEAAYNQGSELSGDELATLSVVDHSGDGLNKGEGCVNTESEEGNTEDEGPEVRSGEGLSSGGVGSEGESSGTVVLGDGGSNPLEVSNNGEDRETGKEGDKAVTERNDEHISDNGLVSSVVGSVRSHDSHADSEREENLADGIGPHLSVNEHLANISGNTVNLSLKVHADTFISVR